ncbi:MAG TPA: hypothetical protein PLV27_07655 [Anaerolineaceae bacterium]|nr:hypothetical protein [Anaerolineaceae bacterium]
MSTYPSGKFKHQNLPNWQIFEKNEFQTGEGWNGILGKNWIPVEVGAKCDFQCLVDCEQDRKDFAQLSESKLPINKRAF